MIGVDVGQFNVNQQKNLKQNMGNCERNEKVIGAMAHKMNEEQLVIKINLSIFIRGRVVEAAA